jgi:hypothetical protein
LLKKIKKINEKTAPLLFSMWGGFFLVTLPGFIF